MRMTRAFRRFMRSSAGRATSLSIVILAGTAGAALLYFHLTDSSEAAAVPAHAAVQESSALSPRPEPPTAGGTGVLSIPENKARSLGLETALARRDSWTKRLRVTGRLELNTSRVAHVNPLVDGVVREVPVEVGQTVKPGDVLAYIDSREVGEAKLALVKDRLQVASARRTSEWHTTVQQNTSALVELLEGGESIANIQKAFRDRPVGAYREQLVSALARLTRANADFERIRALTDKHIIPEKEVIRSRAEHEAAEATYRALIEQTRFDAQQKAVDARHALQAAEAAAAISRSHLLILGYREADLDSMDPLAEAGRIAYFPVRAPIAGTVIARNAQLSMHVNHQTELLRVADLSTVWLRADVFEKDLAAVGGLQGRQVSFRANSYPDRKFTANVFSLGDLVNDETRAVGLLAIAENPERLLKPGMFVDIELSPGEDAAVLQVPAAAIQRHSGATFVFVADGHAAFQRREVQVGRSTAEVVEILAGLTGGEAVVVRGGFALKSEMLSDLLAEE